MMGGVGAFQPDPGLARSALELGRPETVEERQRGFASVLGRAAGDRSSRGGQSDPESVVARAREAAEQLVSIALVQPLLSQLRSTNHAAPPFAPSPGERQFQSLVDAQVSQGIVRAGRFPLVDRLAEVMLARAGELEQAP